MTMRTPYSESSLTTFFNGENEGGTLSFQFSAVEGKLRRPLQKLEVTVCKIRSQKALNLSLY